MYYTSLDNVPHNHYNVVYADPPWSYNDKMTGHSMSLDHEYATQSLAWLKSLPVAAVAAKDACLLLWVTSPMLPDGLAVMRAWGFKYVTVAFCWVKHMPSGKDAVNLGRWTMGGCELCLLGRRGKMQRADRKSTRLNSSHLKLSRMPSSA